MPVKTIEINSNQQRVFLFVGVVVVAFLAILFVKWSFGNTISIRAEQKEVAEVSTSFAPDDPQTHYASAVLLEKSFLPEDFEKSVAEYEKAAALSPNDFLLWLALGKARERNGDTEAAEKALRRAVELAPNYVDARWTLGNNLLRQGKSEEGFREIRMSADNGEKYVLPAIATAWTIFDGDISQIKRNIGDSAKLNAFLAVFLLNQNRFDDAFNIWNGISEVGKSEAYRAQSEEVYNRFLSAGKFRYARIVKASLDGFDGSDVFGKITSGGFDNNVRQEKSDFFDWQIGAGAQPLIGYDDKVKRGGDLSLVIIFNSPDGLDFRNFSQTVAVEAGKTYSFKGFYKADLKTAATLRWEIVNATDNSIIATTDSIAATADWTNFESSFSVPQNAEAIIIRLARVKCGSTICPISGKVWFDDFSIN